VGILAALGLSRFLSAVLFEVRPLDPWVYSGAAAFALVTVMAASLVPALDSLRVDPAATIKAD
jgi:ABC-type antimicrobial peptide transport system permease subunit